MFSLDSLLDGYVKYPPKLSYLLILLLLYPVLVMHVVCVLFQAFLLLNDLFEHTGTRLAATQ